MRKVIVLFYFLSLVFPTGLHALIFVEPMGGIGYGKSEQDYTGADRVGDIKFSLYPILMLITFFFAGSSNVFDSILLGIFIILFGMLGIGNGLLLMFVSIAEISSNEYQRTIKRAWCSEEFKEAD